jgi:DNA (cytosine-5)-methyltransferase 1
VHGGGLAAVHLSRFTQNGIGAGADEPLDTVMAGAPKFGVIAAFLAQHNNDTKPNGVDFPRAGRSVDDPLNTVTTQPQQSVVAAFLAQHNTGEVGHDARSPVSTIVGKGCTQGVVAAHMMRQFGTSVGHSLDEPTHTDTAGVNKSALIAPFLTKYYGQGDGAAVDGPLHTDTTKDRFGLVTVEIDGQSYAIADIGMRMLTPRERFRAQGFPDSYIIDRRPDGSPITQTGQGSCCGNSVSPPLAEALAAANCSHLVEFREAAE